MYSANSQFVGGQSIPTFDYELAPYVAKSFINNILKYLDMNEVITEDIQTIKKKLLEYTKNHHSIMGEDNLKDIESIIYDVIKDDYVIPGMCIRSAVKYTDKDTYQAMEALIHNLNTMNSRAGKFLCARNVGNLMFRLGKYMNG